MLAILNVSKRQNMQDFGLNAGNVECNNRCSNADGNRSSGCGCGCSNSGGNTHAGNGNINSRGNGTTSDSVYSVGFHATACMSLHSG